MSSRVTGTVQSTTFNVVRLDDGNTYPWGISVSDSERDLARGRVTLLLSDNGVVNGILPGWPSTGSSVEPDPVALAPTYPEEEWCLRASALDAALKWHTQSDIAIGPFADVVTTARYFEWYLRGGKK